MANTPDLPYQMEVYFPQFPTLDFDALARFIDSCEPSPEEPCEVRGLDDAGDDQGPKVGGFVASLRDLNIGTLIHNNRSPIDDLVRSSGLRPDLQEPLLAHRSWALLTQVGGEGVAIDRMLLLYKVATGMCLQGAVGVLNLATNRLLPAGVLMELFAQPRDDEGNYWHLLRTEGEPLQLLVSMGQIDLQGRRFLATRGYGHYGLPDLLWEFTDAASAEETSNLFHNCFTYLLQRGPVIQAGHTIGYDANVAFRFLACPPDLELPYPTSEVLLVSKVAT